MTSNDDELLRLLKAAKASWSVIDLKNGFYKIENHESKKNTCISLKTTDDRHYAFQLLKGIGFDEEQRAKVWGQILAEENRKDKSKRIGKATKVFIDYMEMADQFIKIQPLFYTKQRIWWLWNFDNKCWEMIDEIDLLNRMGETIEGLALFRPQLKSEVLNALKMRGRMNIPKEAKRSWVQLKDTIFDIKTGLFFEATPEYFITNPLPWKLGKSEETPVIDKLFRDWVEEKYVPTLYEICAYTMLPDYPLHRVFCLNGEGRNGKGTFLQVLTNLIGKDNVCSTDFDTLTTRPFEAAKLYRKLVCLMGEINSSIFKRTSLFKKLTGSDMIGFEFKGKDGFDDYNYAKLIIATNKIPESTDKTIGFYSRWLIVDFVNRFKEKPNLLEMVPEEEYGNLARKCIRILKTVLVKGEFTGDGEIEDKRKRYEERASPLKEFLKLHCDTDPIAEVPFWELYEEYVAYLEERGFRRASKRELSNLIRAKGYETKRTHFTKPDGTDGTMVVVLGLCLTHLTDEEKAELGGLRYS